MTTPTPTEVQTDMKVEIVMQISSHGSFGSPEWPNYSNIIFKIPEVSSSAQPAKQHGRFQPIRPNSTQCRPYRLKLAVLLSWQIIGRYFQDFESYIFGIRALQRLRVLLDKWPDFQLPTVWGQFLFGCSINSTYPGGLPKGKSLDLGPRTVPWDANQVLELKQAFFGRFI